MSASKKIKDCQHCQKFLENELKNCQDWEVNRKRIIEEVKNSSWNCPNYGGRHDIVDYKEIHHFENCQDKDCVHGCWVRVNHLLACEGKFSDRRPEYIKKGEKCPTCGQGGNIHVIPTSDGIISVSCNKCGTQITSNNGFGDSNVNNHNCQIQQNQQSQSSQSNQTQSQSTFNNQNSLNRAENNRERERERESNGNSKSNLPWILGGVGITVLIAGLIWYFAKKGGEK